MDRGQPVCSVRGDHENIREDPAALSDPRVRDHNWFPWTENMWNGNGVEKFLHAIDVREADGGFNVHRLERARCECAGRGTPANRERSFRLVGVSAGSR